MIKETETILTELSTAVGVCVCVCVCPLLCRSLKLLVATQVYENCSSVFLADSLQITSWKRA